ncbi:MAG: hypothetical protein HYS57_02940 [Parcubacteria group bacterium]|nr:hypothetical protein [Parcubacteria group bacterium]
MKLKFVALVATLLAEPFSVSAAISELPFGSTNKLVAYYVPRTDYLRFHLSLPGDALVSRYLGRVYFTETGEKVNNLARRSQAEFVTFIERKMREMILTALPEMFEPSLEGQTLYVEYVGETRVGGSYVTATTYSEAIAFSVSRAGNGAFLLTGVFKANLNKAVSATAFRIPLFVKDFKSATLVLKDPAGNVTDKFDSTESDPYDLGMAVWEEEDVVWVRTEWLVMSPRGEFRIWYEGGREEVTDTKNGETLITYLSPPVALPAKRLGVPRVTDKGIELPYEATDDEQVLIKRASPDLTVWYPLPHIPVQPPVEPSGIRPASTGPVRIRTATAPRDNNGSGFFRAEVVSAVAPQEAQKR